jgi:alkaline phosphatase D
MALSRRALLKTASALTALGVLARPSLSFAPDRPQITHAVQSGDVSMNSGVVWARADRPSRMSVEIATTDTFRDAQRAVFVDALPESDFTAKALIEDLPPGQDIFYRLSFQDLSTAVFGEPQAGHFRTPANDRRPISFLWSGDTMGQGWGIDVSRGGMRSYAAMRRSEPDFFIHCGDNIYADCPIAAEQKLPDGAIWRSIVTEEKSKAAETLADYRGNYKYNLLDDNLRAFNAAVPTLALWDNHEVMETWWPDEPLPQKPAGDNSALIFTARGRRAFHEFMPMRETPAEPGRVYRKMPYGPLLDVFMLDMRSYRGPDGAHDRIYRPDDALLGPAQVAWLKRELAHSRATWKVIAADSPIGYVVNSAGIDHADGPRGRGLEIADLLSFIKRAGIHNILWLTADLHYTARASLRSEPRHLSGFRAVLGIRLRPAPRRDLERAAILRSRGNRRRHRQPDRYAEGRRGSRPVVGHARSGATGAGANNHESLACSAFASGRDCLYTLGESRALRGP